MSERLLTLEVVDVDGAIRETREAAMNRSDFVKKVFEGGAIVTGGIMLAGLPSIALAGGRPSAAQDTEILNFALTLEFLEAAFYTQASAKSGLLSGEPAMFSRVVGAHERAHVAFLQKALGSAAVPEPNFDFMNSLDTQALFLATAQTLEDTGVAAYNGQGPRLRKQTLPAAASVVSVEARHAAWVRDIRRMNPAPDPFDAAMDMDDILAAVTGLGFIVP